MLIEKMDFENTLILPIFIDLQAIDRNGSKCKTYLDTFPIDKSNFFIIYSFEYHILL